MTPEVIARERARLEYAVRTDEIKIRIESQTSKLESLFKNLTLVNGGSIIALFTLLGNSDKTHLSFDVKLLWWSFASFALGLSATISAIGLSFLSQYHFSIRAKRQSWNEQARMFGLPDEYDALSPFERGQRYLISTWVLSLLALASFMVGAIMAMMAVLPA